MSGLESAAWVLAWIVLSFASCKAIDLALKRHR